jgi:SOS-response transcriptional repressor LexA
MGERKTFVTLKIFNFICSYIRREQYPPTLDEIAEGVGKGKTTVLHHLRALEEADMIERKEGSSRAIRIVGAKLILITQNSYRPRFT